MAQLSDITDLLGVVNAVRGQSQTTSGTTTSTQQTDISDQGVQELIRQILSGPGGLSSIGGAARRAGVYDSPTEEMAINDLVARAANQAELARSPTRTTTQQSQVTEVPGLGLGGLATTLGTTSAISSLLKGEIPFSGALDSLRGVTGAASGTGGGLLSGVSDAVSGLLGGGGGSSVAGGFGGQVATGGLSGAAGAASGVASGAGSGFMSNVATGGAASGAASGAGGGILSSVPGGLGGVASGAGGLLSGLIQEEEALGDPGSLLMTLGPAAAVGGPVGAAIAGLGAILGSGLSGGSIQDTIANIPIVGDVLDPIIGGIRSIGSSIGDAVGTIICTALMYKGHIDKEEYRTSLHLMHKLDPATLKGYHWWATSIAKKIRNGHKGWTAFWRPIVKSRVRLINSGGGFCNHIRYPLGTMTKYGIEPTCYLLGKYLEYRERKGVGATEGYNYGR